MILHDSVFHHTMITRKPVVYFWRKTSFLLKALQCLRLYSAFVTMAANGEHSSENKKGISVSLPEPPEKPLDSDCCGTGCIPCVFDIYEEEVKKWKVECYKIKTGKNSDAQLGDCDEALCTTEFRSFVLESITKLTGDSCIYRFNIPGNKKLGIKIGQHLIMRYERMIDFLLGNYFHNMRWFLISVQTDGHHNIAISDLPSLTTLSWVSQFHNQSHTLTSWQLISYTFLKIQTPKYFWSCRVHFQARYQ